MDLIPKIYVMLGLGSTEHICTQYFQIKTFRDGIAEYSQS